MDRRAVMRDYLSFTHL